MTTETPVTDSDVLALLAEIKRQKNEIKTLENSSYLTNSAFSYDPLNRTNSINLRVATLPQLVAITGFLTTKQKEFTDAAKLLGVKEKFAWLDISYDNWLNDLKVQTGKVQLSAKRAKLAKMEARADEAISPELRRKMELRALAAELAELNDEDE